MDASVNGGRAEAQSTPPSAAVSERVDGRRLRSERTRKSIIDAFVLLLRENQHHMPTALQIAERAGYSVRSIFQRFPDLPALRVAAIDLAIDRVFRQFAACDTDADRATRIRAQVQTRARVC